MKRFLFILRHGPHGTAYGKEGLDAILMASAFVPTSLMLLGDGIFQILRDQDTDALGVKNFAATYAALEHYEVSEIYVSASDLAERGLTEADLAIAVTPLDDEALRSVMRERDTILTF